MRLPADAFLYGRCLVNPPTRRYIDGTSTMDDGCMEERQTDVVVVVVAVVVVVFVVVLCVLKNSWLRWPVPK